MEHFGSYYGNGRDKPTAFLYRCSNWGFGCTYTKGNRTFVSRHEASCSAKKIEALHSRKEVKKAFACNEPGCQSSFDAQWGLTGHIKSVHKDWQPHSCIREGCDPKIIYQTKAQFRTHRKRAHSRYKPTACTVPGCSSTTVFEIHDSYEQHLRLVHKLSREAKSQHIRLSPPI
jgi:hypothetical protein